MDPVIFKILLLLIAVIGFYVISRLLKMPKEFNENQKKMRDITNKIEAETEENKEIED